jgi:hypothetical protein
MCAYGRTVSVDGRDPAGVKRWGWHSPRNIDCPDPRRNENLSWFESESFPCDATVLIRMLEAQRDSSTCSPQRAESTQKGSCQTGGHCQIRRAKR